MIDISFDDYADTVARQWADALVANACNGDSVDIEPCRTYADDLATMRGGIIEANNVWHSQASLDGWTASPPTIGIGKLVALDSS